MGKRSLADFDGVLTHISNKRNKYWNEAPNINCLPEEVLLRIFKYLPTADKYSACLVCLLWSKICNDRELWNRIQPSNSTISPVSLQHLLQLNPKVLSLACIRLTAPKKGHKKYTASDGENDIYGLYPSIIPSLRVEYFDLSSCSLPGEVIDMMLEKCDGLQKLSLQMCTVTPHTLGYVSCNRQLTELNLAGIMADVDLNDVINVCRECTRLTSVNLSCVRHHRRVTDLARPDDTDIPALLHQLVRALPTGIKELDVSNMGEHFTTKHVDMLVGRCRELTYLDLSSCAGFSKATLECVAHNLSSTLRVLVLNHLTSMVSIQDFNILREMTALRHVSIAHRYPAVSGDVCRVFHGSRVQTGTIYRSLVASPAKAGRTDMVWGRHVPP